MFWLVYFYCTAKSLRLYNTEDHWVFSSVRRVSYSVAFGSILPWSTPGSWGTSCSWKAWISLLPLVPSFSLKFWRTRMNDYKMSKNAYNERWRQRIRWRRVFPKKKTHWLSCSTNSSRVTCFTILALRWKYTQESLMRERVKHVICFQKALWLVSVPSLQQCPTVLSCLFDQLDPARDRNIHRGFYSIITSVWLNSTTHMSYFYNLLVLQ